MKPLPDWMFPVVWILVCLFAVYGALGIDWESHPAMDVILGKFSGCMVSVIIGVLMQLNNMLADADISTWVFSVGSVAATALFLWGILDPDKDRKETLMKAAWGVSGFLAGVQVGGRTGTISRSNQRKSNMKNTKIPDPASKPNIHLPPQ